MLTPPSACGRATAEPCRDTAIPHPCNLSSGNLSRISSLSKVTPLQHTFGHVNCPACAETRDLFLYDAEKFRATLFPEASSLWLESRKLYKKPRTIYENRLHIKRLAVFFWKLTLDEIHPGHLPQYQRARLANDGGTWFKPRIEGETPFPEKAQASLINHELSTLQLILKMAKVWDERFAPYYTALKPPAPKDPKVLSDQEEMFFFAIAEALANAALKKKRYSKFKALVAAMLTCNTGASGTELRHLRFDTVFLNSRVPFFIIKPETAKNDVRGRHCALNPSAEKYLREQMEIIRRAGGGAPDDHVFPWWQRGRYNFKKPATASWLRYPWKELQKATDWPWLTPHCFRHQHITLRIEAGEPIELIAKDVGHSAVAMTRMYTHVRREKQMESVMRIDSRSRHEKLLAKRTA